MKEFEIANVIQVMTASSKNSFNTTVKPVIYGHCFGRPPVF